MPRKQETAAMPSQQTMTLPEATELVLDTIGDVFDTYVVFPSDEARDAAVLWTAHTYVFQAFDATPRLAFNSAEPASGKSRALEITENLSSNPFPAVYMTPGVMWRKFEQGSPTMFLDEVDTIFGRNGSSSAHQYLRGVINAGHRKGATVPRCVGTTDVKNFNVFGPVAMAGLGRLPETIATRSVEIVMRRRKAGDREVRPLRMRYAEDEFKRVRQLLEAWGEAAKEPLTTSVTELPVQDRKADVWEPLVAIADMAGEDWAERARKACVLLTTESSGKPTSLGVQLLIDIRTAFAEHDHLFTYELVDKLHSLDDANWTPSNLDGKRLARVLSEYGVGPQMLRRGDKTARGYKRQAFADAWDRYVPSKESSLVDA